MSYLTIGMSYLTGVLLLASFLALGQAAPASAQYRYPYKTTRGPFQQALNQLKEVATQESVNPGDLLRAAGELIDVFHRPRANEQLSVSWGEKETANAEGAPNYGNLARALGSLIDSFDAQEQANQEAAGNQEMMADEQRSLHREDYGKLLGAVGGLLG